MGKVLNTKCDVTSMNEEAVNTKCEVARYFRNGVNRKCEVLSIEGKKVVVKKSASRRRLFLETL